MSVEILYELFLSSSGIITDSRNCIKNSIFFALKGDRFNGNIYADEAIVKGCAYAVVDEKPEVINDRFIMVDDVLTTLQQLATYHRKKLGIPILAITGTNGKTTTKELVTAVLRKKFNVSSTVGNLNNHIGVPLTLLSMTKDTEFGVVEMGANHIGEIKMLCDIACPDYGIITNIGKAHIEGFGSFEGVLKTKKELYDYIESFGSLIFYNANDSVLKSILPDIEKVSYSIDSNIYSDYVMSSMIQKPEVDIEWFNTNKKKYRICTKIIGGYNAPNIMAAISVGCYFGVSAESVNYAITSYVSDNNRSQLITTDNNTLLLDAYNANPSSMKASLENFDLIEHSNKVVIIGGMKELGDVSLEEHQKLCDYLSIINLKCVLIVGAEFNEVKGIERFRYYSTTNVLCEFLLENPIQQALILIKGSRGNALEKVVPYL
ncbi:MAG: UDP-N-acetylmuramoyl-tripeptide--D-alanyl-D-alanine ligase [Marinilabiliaceae bacterium]|nr:UDP-N-acetylmuramoyl-tripeptide--D-alanyl-D-alanine ligase [Marinilabiliaceae bacterium]